MVKLLATKLANKDIDSQQGNINETSLQQAIAKQLELSMPSIIEATVNHMLQNKLLDKTIKTTVGTTVSTMTGDIVQPVEKKKTPRVRINKEPMTSDTEDDATSSSTDASSAHQRQISAQTRARNKNQSNNEQSEKPPPKNPGEVHQE